MAQILVRNLDEEVVAKLKERAKANQRSLQSEVRVILGEAARLPNVMRVDMEKARRMIEEIREKNKGRKFPDSVELIREDRDK